MLDLAKPAACLDVLRKLHPVDAPSTHEMLSRMVRALLASPPAPNQHLEVLEAAREALDFCQHELSRRFIANAARPGSEADRHLQRVVALWLDMARSYAALASPQHGDDTLVDEVALLAQRRLHYAGRALFEYFRAHRAVPAGVWAEVHAGYVHARGRAVDGVRVSDLLNRTWRAQSACEAYIAVLLADLANPYGRSGTELNWILRWVERFAPYCSLIADDGSASSGHYGIDPAADTGLRPLGSMPDRHGVLRFDGSILATRMRAMLTQFKRGVAPAALGLGADCPPEAGSRLLLSLYRPWGRATAGRRFKRRAQHGSMEITTEWAGIGLAISGEVFHQPATEIAPRPLREDLHLMTFGEAVAEVDNGSHAQGRALREAQRLGLESAPWQLLDQSVGGFRICRAADGETLSHRQLVGLRPADGRHCLLGDTRWLMIRDDGTIEAGIEVLPGLPRVVAIRAANHGSAGRPYQQAFLLPGSSALDTPASLVLPVRMFQPDRVIEVLEDGRSRKVTLVRVLRHGANFDECEFAHDDGATAPAR